jgi:cell division septal protein FtsQ
MRKNRHKKFEKVRLRGRTIGITAVIIGFILLGIYLTRNFYHYLSSICIIKEVSSNKNIDRSIEKNIEGKSLLTLDIKNICKEIMRKHPEFKKVNLLRVFPSSLKIEIEERIPFAQWKDRMFYLLDREGVIISEPNRTPFAGFIPIEITNYRHPLKKGFKIEDKRLYDAYNMIDELRNKNLFSSQSITLINPTNPSSFYFVMNGIKVIVGKGDFSRKIYLLDSLLKGKLKEKLAAVKYIDLRYKKIYIGFKR